MAPTDAQQRIAELTTLNALAQTLNKALDMREALDNALSHIVELMGLSTGWIFLLDEGGVYRLAARHQLPPALNYPGPPWDEECSCQELCGSGKLNKAVNMVQCSRLRRAVGDKRGLSQHASVPLISGSDVLGILNVATTAWGRFSPPQLQLLSAVGFLLGTAIARARLYEQVKVRRVQEQGALLRLSQELLVADALEPALHRLVQVSARLLGADACAYIEADEQVGRAVLRATHGWDLPPSSPWPLVLDPSMPHLWYLPERSSNLTADSLEPLPPALGRQRFNGHLSVSVNVGNIPVGMLLVNSHSARHFFDDEMQLLEVLASQLAQTLERERLQQESLARQRLEQELDLARDIQASFLPNSRPSIRGYSLDAFYLPARQVGGDFYDFIYLPEKEGGETPAPMRDVDFYRTSRRGAQLAPAPPPTAERLGIVIADVTDKGVPAALFMALSRTLLRATASDGRPPAAVMDQSNRLILADARAGLFVTCFYAILDPRRHELTYADGGHNYPLLYHASIGEIEQLHARGIVLGIVPDPQFDQHSVRLEPGDLICFYTDGVTEAMNPERELFGEERLADVLRASHALSPREIIERITAAVVDFAQGQPQADDVTIVVLKRE
jgi:sigma-B regulation protein RsbU (phosphoserine phosphatase)